MTRHDGKPAPAVQLCRPLTECRLCASEQIVEVLTLTPTPPANGLIAANDLGKPVAHFPLRLMRCEACGHVQLGDIVNPELLFSHYLYVSGTSGVMRRHLQAQAEDILRRHALTSSSPPFVVEIGSNDGSLLKAFQARGARVLGVDPARNIAQQAIAEGVPTVIDFFGADVARKLSIEHGKANAVVANHCFAHIEDINSVVEGVKAVLAPNGTFVFEVGYFLDVYEKKLFDTIYHEHLDYHHVTALKPFFERHGMTLVDVERQDIQGGALRGFVKHGTQTPQPSVAAAIATEKAAGLGEPETYRHFAEGIAQRARELKDLLGGLKAKGKSIAGYGMPAKATTLLYHFGITRDVIDFIADANPLKQGLFGAGLEIPIVAPSRLSSDRPDYVVILAWNFADDIVAANPDYLSAGGQFIVPLPDLVIRAS